MSDGPITLSAEVESFWISRKIQFCCLTGRLTKTVIYDNEILEERNAKIKLSLSMKDKKPELLLDLYKAKFSQKLL